MWSVLSASHPLHNISLYEVSEGVCGYTFTLELNSEPTTLAWIMRDSLQEATDAVLDLLANPVSHQDIKRPAASTNRCFGTGSMTSIGITPMTLSFV